MPLDDAKIAEKAQRAINDYTRIIGDAYIHKALQDCFYHHLRLALAEERGEQAPAPNGDWPRKWR